MSSKNTISLIDIQDFCGFIAPKNLVSSSKLSEILEELDLSTPSEVLEVENRFKLSKEKNDWINGEELAKSENL